MNKRKGFADEVAKQAKQGLQPVLKADNGSQPDSQKKTVHIGGHFSPEVHRELKLLAIEKDMQLREVLADAFNMYLRSNKRPAIAE